jgi:integrase
MSQKLAPLARTNMQRSIATMPQAIAESVRDYVDHSKADNTKATYRKAWAAYQDFCTQHGYEASDTGAAVHYLTQLADGGYKVATIGLHKSAISFMHGGRTGAPNPALSPEVRTLMQGIGRKRAKTGETAEQARPILLSELRQMVNASPATLGGLRDRAIVLIGWFAALRRSEIASLNVQSLALRDDALVVTLGATKTDQAGEGYKLTLPVLKDKTIDPSQAVRDWLKASGLETGPLFVRVDKWGHAGRARINDRHIDTTVKRLADLSKLSATKSDYRRISGHSLRAGFATEAARRGMAAYRIKQITRHKSDAVLNRYIREGGGAMIETIREMVGE